MALTSYNDIPNSDIDPESPITTSLMTDIRDNPIAMIQSDNDASCPDHWHKYPEILINHGSEDLGTVDVTTTLTHNIGVYEYVNFTVSVGGVLTSNGFINIIRATDTITIAGTINHRGSDIDASTAVLSSIYNFGSGSGGGGGAQASDTANGSTGADGNSGLWYAVAGGGAGGSVSLGAGSNGSNGTGLTTAQRNSMLRLFEMFGYRTSIGGNGSSGPAGSSGSGGSGGTGGYGGGILILCAPTIIVSGTIDLDGQDGTNGSAGTGNSGDGGGGGGGAGGELILVGQSITNTGTVTTSGGAAGTSASGGDGGAGADGSTTTITLV